MNKLVIFHPRHTVKVEQGYKKSSAQTYFFVSSFMFWLFDIWWLKHFLCCNTSIVVLEAVKLIRAVHKGWKTSPEHRALGLPFLKLWFLQCNVLVGVAHLVEIALVYVTNNLLHWGFDEYSDDFTSCHWLHQCVLQCQQMTKSTKRQGAPSENLWSSSSLPTMSQDKREGSVSGFEPRNLHKWHEIPRVVRVNSNSTRNFHM